MDLIDIGHQLKVKSPECHIINALYNGKTRINIIDEFSSLDAYLFITIRHQELEAEFKAVNSDNNPMYYVRNTNDLLHFCSNNDLYSCLHYMKDNKISIPFLRPDSKINVKDNALLLNRQLFRHFIDIKADDLEEFITNNSNNINITNITNNNNTIGNNPRLFNVRIGDLYILKLELLDGFIFVHTDKLLIMINNQINKYQPMNQKYCHDK